MWLLICGIVLLVGVYALRGVLIAPHAIAFLERTVAANLGLQVSIGHLGGSFFSNLEIKNVTTVQRLTDDPLADLQLHRLKLTYRLWDFFKGWQAFLAGASIDIDQAQLSIDLTGETTPGSGNDVLKYIFLPPRLPRLTIHNSSLQIKGSDYETRFKGISLAAEDGAQESSKVRLHVAQWSLDHSDLRKVDVPLEAQLTYSPESLKFEKLSIDGQPLVEAATFELRELPNRIPFEVKFNLTGGGLAASGHLAADRLKIAFSGSDLDLSRISELLAPPAEPFGGRLTLKGQLDLPFDRPKDLVSEITAQVVNGSINDTTVENLAFRFSADGRQLGMTDLELTNGPNRLLVYQAAVPADIAYGDDLDAFLTALKVDWQLDASDVPAVLSLFGLALEAQDDLIPSHRLVLSGRMADGEIIIPDGRLETAGGHIFLKAGKVTLPLGERTLRDSPLAADLDIDMPDMAVLSRIFTLPALGGALKGQIVVSGTLPAPRGTASLSGKALTYRGKALGNLSIRAKADAQAVVIESALLERGQDRASGSGTLNLKAKSYENVTVELAVSDLAPYFSDLIPLFRPPSQKIIDLAGSLKATVKLAGPFAGPAGSLRLRSRQIRFQGTPCGDAEVDLTFSEDRLKVASAELRNLKDRLQLSGSLRFRDKQLEKVQAQAAISNLARYKTLWPAGFTDLAGSMQGRLQATGDVMQPDAEADLRFEKLHIKDFQLEKGSVRLKSAGRMIRVETVEATTGRQRLELAGDIRRSPDDTVFDIRLKKAAVIGHSPLLALEHEAGCRLSRSGRIAFENVALAGPAGRISLNGRLDPAGESDLLIAVSGLTSDGWLDLIFTDRLRFQGLDARIRISGQPGAPLLAVQGALENLGSPKVPMAFSGQFNLEYGHKVLKINQFAWQGLKGQQVHLTGTLPIDPSQPDIFAAGPIMLNGRVRIDDAGVLAFIIPWAESTGGSIQCDLNLAGTWRHPIGTLHLDVHDLKRPPDIRPLPPGPYTVTGNVRIDGDLVGLESLEAYSSGWKIQMQGQWRGLPTLPQLTGPGGRKLTGQVDLAGSLAVSDLSWVAREVDGVRRLSGSVEAQGTLQGSITAPRADAIIKLSDAEFAPDIDMPSLQGLNLEAAVTPQAVNIRSLTGQLGGAPFELTGTWQLGTAAGSSADLRLRGENILLYRDESLRLRADTDLTVKGPLSRLELAGEIAVTDGRFAKNFGVLEGIATAGKPSIEGGFRLFSFRNPPLRDMVFDIRITAKEPFIVRNNLIHGSARPDLVLSGTGEVPLLVGKVYVESTRLYLPAGRLQLENGLVRFERADPDRPKLDLIGTSTMLGYDITAVIEGPYDEPVITLSSIPSLPNEDLLMLLLAGQPPKNSTARSNTNRQSLNIAVFLGRDLISRLFGSDSDESFESILDRFDIEVGRAITQQGEDTINSQFRIANDVLLKGDSLYLTGERDYFDYYNGGIKLVFRFR